MFELKAIAQAKDKFEIMMYGTISQWDKVNASDFAVSMQDAIAKGAKEIILPTHSGGGSIYEGVAMGNEIQRARAKGIKVICRIDGLCASMMTAVAANCDKVQAASNIRMMVHEGSVGIIGNSKKLREGADQLDTLNSDIAEALASKTGKTKDWILANWMVAGVDKWFTASKAYDAKLVDEIIPAYGKKLPALTASNNWLEMAASYDEIFNPDNTMLREQMIALLGLDANATDEQIKVTAEAMKAKASTAAPAAAAPAPVAATPAPTPTASDDKAVKLILKIAGERGVTDAKKLKNIEEVAKINFDAAMDMLPEKKEEDQVRLSEVIAQLKGGDTAGDRKNWGFNEWQTKDPKGFNEMLEKEPKKYIALFKAEFGIEPTLAELQGVSA